LLKVTPLSTVSNLLSLELFYQFFVDDNHHIFVYKDDMWTVKGRYEYALENHDDVSWTYENGQDVLWFLLVSVS
jgi:hypothetical protein